MSDLPARIPVYLDCDTGIDDALALGYLLASPRVDFVGIGSVSGNVSAAQGAANTLDLLELAGRAEVPVAIGEHDFQTHPYSGGAPHVHGEAGIGNVELLRATANTVDESAAEMIVRLAHEFPGELRMIAIGPLTNLAAALRLDPELPSLVHTLTIMGGACLVPGNVSAVAEANIHNDPEAAKEVFAAAWPITMVGLDVTMQHLFESRHRDALLASPKPFAVALGQMLDVYFDFYLTVFGRRVSALHDPLAAAIALGDLTLTEAPVVEVEVDTTDGPGRGQTVADLRGRFLGHPLTPEAHTTVVLSVGEDFAEVLLERLLAI
jgi:purine nucleosidase